MASALLKSLTSSPPQIYSFWQRLPRVFSCLSLGIALLALTGWHFENPYLRSVLPELTPMMPITAFAVIICSLANLTLSYHTKYQSQIIMSCSIIVFLIGALSLFDQWVHFNLNIHMFLYQQKIDALPLVDGRMAVSTAILLILYGLSLLLTCFDHNRYPYLIQGLLFVGLLFSCCILIAYNFNVTEFTHTGQNVRMALNTAFCLALLNLAMLYSMPNFLLPNLIQSSSYESKLIRKLLPRSILFTWLIGWLIQTSHEKGLVNESLAFATFTLVMLLSLTLAIIYYATNIQHSLLKKAEAEAAAKLKSKQFETIFNQAPLGVAVIDSHTGQIYLTNPKYAEIIGRTVEEMLTIDWMSFTHPDDIQPDLDNMTRLNQGLCETFEMDKRYIKPNGQIVWVHMTIAKLAVESHLSPRHLCMVEDITDKKLYLENIQQLNQTLEAKVKQRTQDLEAANQELESFSYSVSHDLRTPLRAIDGFSSKLEKTYKDQLDEEGKRLISIIRDNAIRMGQLIDDILAFSRSGRLEIQKSRIDLNALIQTIWQELGHRRGDRHVELEVENLPIVMGDPTMMRQVLTNLLDNAIKFTQNQEKAHIKVYAKKSKTMHIFYIEDNGAGFDNRYKDKLFGVFQRLHSIEEFEGTGIGLAIIKRIINRHGGEVDANGVLNQGATFSFSLPIKESRHD